MVTAAEAFNLDRLWNEFVHHCMNGCTVQLIIEGGVVLFRISPTNVDG